MQGDPRLRAIVPVGSSQPSGPVTDEELLALVRMPEAKALQLMGHLINQLYLETETGDIPGWLTEHIRRIVCPHNKSDLLGVEPRNYLTLRGGQHIVVVFCREGHSTPVMGFAKIKPERVSQEVGAAIELWRTAYESQILCPNCESSRLGESRLHQLISQGRAMVKTRCLRCRTESYTGLLWFYQDPLRQGPAPDANEVLLVHEQLKERTWCIPSDFNRI